MIKSPCIETCKCLNCRISIHGDSISSFHRVAISVFQYTDVAKSLCIKSRYFSIIVFQYTVIEKLPCIKTWRFHFLSCQSGHIHVMKHGDFTMTMFWNKKISLFCRANLMTSVFRNTDLQKSLCINLGYCQISMFCNMDLEKSQKCLIRCVSIHGYIVVGKI